MPFWMHTLYRWCHRRFRRSSAHRYRDHLSPHLGVTRLEERRVLNADFSLVAGTSLTMDNFTQVTDENLSVTESGTNYVFNLDEGAWTGTDVAGVVTGATTNTLTVDKAAVDAFTTGIIIDDTAEIAEDITFGTANFSGLTGSLQMLGAGTITQSAASTVSVSTFHATADRSPWRKAATILPPCLGPASIIG